MLQFARLVVLCCAIWGMPVLAADSACQASLSGYQASIERAPVRLVLLDSRGQVLREHPLRSADQFHATADKVYLLAAEQRHSFVLLVPALDELWEISLDPQAKDIPQGFIHDYRMREGEFIPGYLNPRRSRTGTAYQRWQLSADQSLLRLTEADGGGVVFSLDARRVVAPLPVDQHPQLHAVRWAQTGHGPCR